ncbi:MAG: flgA [Rickettsiaceae bacterium]|jgi:flagella basal body P-ring formation protein FlgA|nr:flgA [Rickettsiaceae bacterium]
MTYLKCLSVFLLLISPVFAEDSELLLVREALKNSLSNKVHKIDVEYDYLQDDKTASASPSFVRVTRVVQKHGTFNARVYYTDNSAKEISGRYKAFTEVPMVKRYIKRGEVLSEEDLSHSDIDITKSEQNIINNNEHIVGLQAKRDLQPGYVLKNSDLSHPSLIKENDEVTLIYKTNAIEVKATGIALKAGAAGDTIKVKNDRSNKIISGVIVAKGMVQVNRDNHAN